MQDEMWKDDDDQGETWIPLHPQRTSEIEIELAKCSTDTCLSTGWTRKKIASDLALEIIMNKKPELRKTRDMLREKIRDIESNKERDIAILEQNPMQAENANDHICLRKTIGVIFSILVVATVLGLIFAQKKNNSSNDRGN